MDLFPSGYRGTFISVQYWFGITKLKKNSLVPNFISIFFLKITGTCVIYCAKRQAVPGVCSPVYSKKGGKVTPVRKNF
jgi:hypothetical protein